MTYICIKCNATWVIGKPSDQPSGAYCENCAVDQIRQRQRLKGYPDCFRRSLGHCDQYWCRYYSACVMGIWSAQGNEKAENSVSP